MILTQNKEKERDVQNKNELNNKIEKKEQKIGRNDKCPCNSGKKYKYCCGST